MKHSPYSRFDLERMNYRDFLAMDRTTLANERTFLAYGRTALMLLVSGLTFVKLFADSAAFVYTGAGLCVVGPAVFLVGLVRYWQIRKAIYTALDRLESEADERPEPAHTNS